MDLVKNDKIDIAIDLNGYTKITTVCCLIR